jgi:hypothetical protein
MHLVQLLLPRCHNSGERIPAARFVEVREELTERFGGFTAYTRSPAEGAWKDDDGSVDRDEVIICEVMVEDLDRAWWARYRRTLESRFGQEELVARAIRVEML